MPVNQQIFLCHAREDKESVRPFYERLKDEGFEPWIDEESLLPGQNWEQEIPRALRASAAVVVFLSKISVAKKGYVQREFKLAYDALQEIPEGQVFIIPVKLDACTVPPSFRSLQWASMKSPSGTDKVIESLRRHLPSNLHSIKLHGDDTARIESEEKYGKLNISLLEALLDGSLPEENKKGWNEDYEGLLRDLRHFDLDSIEDLSELLPKHLDRILERERQLAAEGRVWSTPERVRRGVFLTHTGMTRMMLAKEFGDAWKEYLRGTSHLSARSSQNDGIIDPGEGEAEERGA